MASALTVVARIHAAKGKGDAMAAFLTEQAAVVLKAEKGCHVYRVHRSTKDPELFLFYETYADEAAFDVHRNSAHLADFRQRREQQGLAAGPAEVEVYRALTD